MCIRDSHYIIPLKLADPPNATQNHRSAAARAAVAAAVPEPPRTQLQEFKSLEGSERKIQGPSCKRKFQT